mmetsp:Transcript_40715/g.68153  ORF Transcript_40715/g.68153 Transcript_40715/m.68153 type:complete len:592 (+) Transcript_40715:461-2236(+)
MAKLSVPSRLALAQIQGRRRPVRTQFRCTISVLHHNMANVQRLHNEHLDGTMNTWMAGTPEADPPMWTYKSSSLQTYALQRLGLLLARGPTTAGASSCQGTCVRATLASEVLGCPLGTGTQLLLNADQLVVLGHPIRAGARTGLDLPATGPNSKVSDERILRLTGAMGGNGPVVALLGHLDALQGLCHGADLVNLDEDGVARGHADALSEPRGVGDEEIVPDDLRLGAQRLRHVYVPVPVVLVQRVLNGDDGVVLDPPVEDVDHLVGGEQFAGIRLPELVPLAIPLVEQLRGCAVQGNANLRAGLVPSGLYGLHHELQGLVVGEVWCEAPLVPHRSNVPCLLQQPLEGVEDLGHPPQPLAEAFGTDRHHHELLEVDLVICVLPAVDDVGHRHWQLEVVLVAVEVGDVLPEGDALGQGRCAAAGHGHPQDPVGANLALVRGPVDLHHQLVQLLLVAWVHPDELGTHQRVHRLHRLENAFAHVDLLVAITQLHGLILAGGCPRGDGAAAKHAIVKEDVNLHGRVSTRVEDLPGLHSLDHGLLLGQGVPEKGNGLGWLGSDQLLDKVIDKLGNAVLPEVLDISRIGGHCEERGG